jgi:ABC-type glutathione transport system ATPase component
MNKKLLVINLIGGPGSGKSSAALYITGLLKMDGINAEYISEFAKDKVFEKSKAVFENQLYILGKQAFKMSRTKDSMDVIVADSPLFLSLYYRQNCSEAFARVVLEEMEQYDNYYYFIRRVKKYNPVGRFQTEKESDAISDSLLNLLQKYNIEYKTVDGNRAGYDLIVADILKYLE